VLIAQSEVAYLGYVIGFGKTTPQVGKVVAKVARRLYMLFLYLPLRRR